MAKPSDSVDTLTIREIAFEAQADARSVARELRGERVRGVAGDRIRRSLRKRDLPTSETRSEAA